MDEHQGQARGKHGFGVRCSTPASQRGPSMAPKTWSPPVNRRSTVVQQRLKTPQCACKSDANAFVGSSFPFHPNLFQRIGVSLRCTRTKNNTNTNSYRLRLSRTRSRTRRSRLGCTLILTFISLCFHLLFFFGLAWVVFGQGDPLPHPALRCPLSGYAACSHKLTELSFIEHCLADVGCPFLERSVQDTGSHV